MLFKLSYYNIFTNFLNDSGDLIVFNTRTCNKVLITKKCYELLSDGNLSDLPEIVVKDLISKGIIVSENENELDEIIDENLETTYTNDELYEVIQPSANCQLGCYYCGQNHQKANLNNNLSDKILEKIKRKIINGNYKNLKIGWFGGEPLMALPQIRILSKSLKDFCDTNGNGYTAKIVTNGLSLKKNIFLELVIQLNIREIEITLDGVANFHDQHRYTKKGENSFDIIYSNLKSILQSEEYPFLNCDITIRCNVDKKNVDGVVPLINQLIKDNLHTKIKYFYTVNIYSWGLNEANLGSLSKEEFAKLNIEWVVKMLESGFNFSYNIPKRKKITCIATGGDSEMYDPFGNVYNCTEVSLVNSYDSKNYVLENLNNKNNSLTPLAPKPFNDWFLLVKETEKFPCHFCKLLPVCGGSCPKSWVEGNPACPPFKNNIKKLLELDYLVKTSLPSNIKDNLKEFKSQLSIDQFQRT